MSKHLYRHIATNVTQELDDSLVNLFPGAFEEVTPEPETTKASSKKTNSSKEGND